MAAWWPEPGTHAGGFARRPTRRGRGRRLTCALVTAGLVCCAATAAAAFPPERRRDFDQRRPNEYLAVPAVASLPGIGVFAGVISSASNVGGTGIDAAATVAESVDNTDISIRAAALREVPLAPKYLTIEYQYADIKFGNFQTYLPGRESPDFTIPVTGEFNYQFVRPFLRFWERRLNFFYALGYFDGFEVDENGNEVKAASHTAQAGMILDFTDDVVDPRSGVRLRYVTTLPAPEESVFGRDSQDVELLTGDEELRIERHEVAWYWDWSERLSIAWDVQYFRAVGREGAEEVIPGGSPPLRGYPQGRWSDRYGVFFGVEPRYTIPTNTELDIYIARGIVEGVQIAPFYEVGQVSPDNDDTLFTEMHHSYGAGVRALFEAIVLRLDLAFSDEGPQIHLTIDQPF